MQRIVLLSNSTIAIPAVQILISTGQCCGIVIPHFEHEGNMAMRQLADQFGIPILISDKNGFDEKLSDFLNLTQPDIGVVLTFPFKISKTCLSIPKKGIFNFHFALLPQYRGADPIFWQIRNAEAHGGISVHKMTSKLDEGSILLQKKLEIEHGDTYGAHWQKLHQFVNSVFGDFLSMIATPSFESKLKKQNESLAKMWAKPSVDDLKIDWQTMTSIQIMALVNASNPLFQGALTFLNNLEIRLFEAELVESKDMPDIQNGALLFDDNSVLVQCMDAKFIQLNVIMTESGVMSAAKFRRFMLKYNLQNPILS